ncbi:MAG: hypothetical protein ACRDRL_00925, partial [Sciscionella sp.]
MDQLAAHAVAQRAADWAVDAEDTRVDYAIALDSSPLSAATRIKYQQRVHAYLEWLGGEARAGRMRGDPLTEPSPRDWAVRDCRRWLKLERKAAPATINHVLAVPDDFHTRLGLGPAATRREDHTGRTAPRPPARSSPV